MQNTEETIAKHAVDANLFRLHSFGITSLVARRNNYTHVNAVQPLQNNCRSITRWTRRFLLLLLQGGSALTLEFQKLLSNL